MDINFIFPLSWYAHSSVYEPLPSPLKGRSYICTYSTTSLPSSQEGSGEFLSEH